MIGTITTTKAAIICAPCLAVLGDLPAGWEKFGIVGLCLVAVGAMYRDGKSRERRSEERQDKLEKIIENNTAALSENAETRREHVLALQNIAGVIQKCHGPK